MKNLTRISTIMALLLLFVISSVSAQELSKSYHESYNVSASAKVQLENKYGTINVDTWDKNQVQIDIEIRVDAKNEKESQKILDKINVKISGNENLVKAVTTFDGKFNCNNCEIDIEFEVKVPSNNSLVLRNDFGNAYVDGRQGPNDLKVEYGKLETGELNGKENTIVVKFGNADVAAVKSANMNLEYSGLELGSAGYLDLYSRFNSIEIGEVSELILDSQYDAIEIASGNDLKIKSGFSDVQINEVFDRLELVSSYGGVEVNRVAGGFSLLDISSEFGGVEIDISSSASYSLQASASFGDIDFPESRADIHKQVEKDFESEIEAFIGDDKSSKSVVKVTVKNAGVEIN